LNPPWVWAEQYSFCQPDSRRIVSGIEMEQDDAESKKGDETTDRMGCSEVVMPEPTANEWKDRRRRVTSGITTKKRPSQNLKWYSASPIRGGARKSEHDE